jgi:hypothetical protein
MRFVFLILFAVLLSGSVSSRTQNDTHITEMRKSAFYTGCIDSFMIFVQTDMYTRPKGKTPQQVVSEYVKICQIRSEIYIREM